MMFVIQTTTKAVKVPVSGTVEITQNLIGHSSSDVGAHLVTERLALDWHFLENHVFCR
jgi:hypothetical protein